MQPALLIPRSPIPIQLFDFCISKNPALCVPLDAHNTSLSKSSVSPCLHLFGHSTFAAPKFFHHFQFFLVSFCLLQVLSGEPHLLGFFQEDTAQQQNDSCRERLLHSDQCYI